MHLLLCFSFFFRYVVFEVFGRMIKCALIFLKKATIIVLVIKALIDLTKNVLVSNTKGLLIVISVLVSDTDTYCR